MININYFDDGIYIYGHSDPETCGLVSFAMWCCIDDCLHYSNKTEFYESANDDYNKQLGLTYVKIDISNEDSVKVLERFKSNMDYYFGVDGFYIYKNKVKVNKSSGLVSFEEGKEKAFKYIDKYKVSRN